MNILYITDTGDIVGGGEVSLLSLLEQLNRDKVTPYVVAPREGKFVKEIMSRGVQVVILPFKKVGNPLNIFNTYATIRRLCEILRQYKIGLVHTNSTGGVIFLAGMAARRNKIPFVSHIRILNSGIISELTQGMFSTRIIAISRATQERFRYLPARKKVVLIHNAVDIKKFDIPVEKVSLRKELNCGLGELLVGTLGRYHRGKGLEYFIRSAKIISRDMPQVKFVIAGLDFDQGNPYARYLKDLIRRHALEGKIILQGKREDIPEFLSALDVFVFPSVCDAFGRVMLEAMAAGKPVIAFDMGGAPEIIEDKVTGFLVSPGDSRELAERTKEVLKDSELAGRLGRNGKARAREYFDSKKHAEKIENLYQELF